MEVFGDLKVAGIPFVLKSTWTLGAGGHPKVRMVRAGGLGKKVQTNDPLVEAKEIESYIHYPSDHIQPIPTVSKTLTMQLGTLKRISADPKRSPPRWAEAEHESGGGGQNAWGYEVFWTVPQDDEEPPGELA